MMGVYNNLNGKISKWRIKVFSLYASQPLYHTSSQVPKINEVGMAWVKIFSARISASFTSKSWLCHCRVWLYKKFMLCICVLQLTPSAIYYNITLSQRPTTVRSNDTLVDTPFQLISGFFHVNQGILCSEHAEQASSRGVLERGGATTGSGLKPIRLQV